MPLASSATRSGRPLAALALAVVVSLLALGLPRPALADPLGYLHPLAPGEAGHAIWDPDLHQFWVVDPSAAGVWSYEPAAARKWTWHGIGEFAMSGGPYWGGTAVFLDRSRQRLVLYADSKLHSLSTGPHANWQHTSTVGPAPAVSSGVIDEAGDRLIFVGDAGALWQLTLSDPPTWSGMGVTAPLTDFDRHTPIVFDPVHRVVVAAGGYYYHPMCPGDVPSNKAWKLPLATMTWSPLPDLPLADMGGSRLLWDAARTRVIATGGYDSYDCGSPFWSGSSQIYGLDMESASPAWTVFAYQPGNRSTCATAIDPDADALVAFGGTVGTMYFGAYESHRDVQVAPLAGPSAGVWTTLSSEPPRAAALADMALDPLRGELLVHGGLLSSTSYGDIGSHGSIDRFDDPDSLWSTLAWAHGARSSAATVDPVRDVMILFGGCAQSPIPVSPCDYDAAATTTVVSLATGAVSEPVTGASPTPRAGAVMTWDSSLGRALLFGGQSPLGSAYDDTWALATASWTWSPISATGTPPTQPPIAAAFDPAGARMFVLSSGTGVQLHALDLSSHAWAEVSMTGTPPALQSIALDAVRSRLLGVDDHLGVHEALLAGSPLSWTQLHAPQVDAMTAAAFYDAGGDRLLIGLKPEGYGSARYGALAVDFGAGALDVPSGAAPAPAALRIAGAHPLPRGPEVEFTLASGEGPARLELYDVLGRRVWTRDVGALGAGTHRVRAGGEAWLPTGVYAIRLVRSGGQSATARAIVIR